MEIIENTDPASEHRREFFAERAAPVELSMSHLAVREYAFLKTPAPPMPPLWIHRFQAAALLLLLLSTAACRADHEAASPPFDAAAETSLREARSGERDSVLAVLGALEQGTLDSAFAQLADLRFTRTTRTEQLSKSGRVQAARHYVLRYEEGARRPPRVLRADSSGAFDFGFLGRFASAERTAASMTDNLAPGVLPEEPAYLSPRSREAYAYRRLPDTLLAGRPTQVFDIRARPGTGNNQDVRHVRLYVDRASGILAAATLERRSRSILFDEATRLFAQIRPAGGGWQPAATRYETRINARFRAPQRLRTASSYGDYAPR